MCLSRGDLCAVSQGWGLLPYPYIGTVLQPHSRFKQAGDTLPDDLTPHKPLDPGRVDFMDPVQMQYWSRELHCTEAELRQTVSEVGDQITAIREHLASRN